MNTVISALHFEWRNISDCLDRATSEFGLDGVELSWDQSFVRAHCTRDDMVNLTAADLSTGVALSTHIWCNLAQMEHAVAHGELLFWLEFCGKTGVTNIIIHGGSSPDRRAGIAHTRKILESVLPTFEESGVVLNLENHYAYEYHECDELFSEPWEFLEVFSLDSPSLRFCFDTGHGNMTGNTTELIKELGPWLDYVHLADNHGVNDDHTVFRDGTVDWDGVFDQLQDVGFDGTFCVEFPVRKDRAPFDLCMAEIRARWERG